jgi:hypothetical protein
MSGRVKRSYIYMPEYMGINAAVRKPKHRVKQRGHKATGAEIMKGGSTQKEGIGEIIQFHVIMLNRVIS